MFSEEKDFISLFYATILLSIICYVLYLFEYKLFLTFLIFFYLCPAIILLSIGIYALYFKK